MRRLRVGTRTVVALVSLLVICTLGVAAALVAGLLELWTVITPHAQHGGIRTRSSPVSAGVLLGLVYGLIPLASAVAVGLGLRGSRRRPAATPRVPE